MILRKKQILKYFFIFIINFCHGQSFTTINYSVPEGLPSSEVYQLYQDRKGFIWMATDNGVVKFDGHEMEKFSYEQGLNDPVVFGFHEDYKGRIWFRTFSGKLSYYENNKVHKYIYNDTLASVAHQSIISSIYIDSLDQLWFATFGARGVWGKIDSRGNLSKEYCYDHKAHFKKIGNGKIFGFENVGVYENKMLVNDQTIVGLTSEANCPSRQLIPLNWKGKLYFSFCRDLFALEHDRLRHLFTADSPIISLSIDNNDQLWIGYLYSGADLFNEPDFKKKWTPDFLKELSVTSVLHDFENGLWFSTLEQGVFYIPNFSIKNHILVPSSKIKVVSKNYKKVLLGTNHGTVFCFNEKGEKQFSKSLMPPIFGLFTDKNKNIWASDRNGSVCFDSTFRLKKASTHLILANITQDSNGIIWALSGRWVIKINPWDNQPLLFQTNFSYRSFLVADSLLFLAKRDGLHIYDQTVKLIHDPKELTDLKISKILKVKDSTFIITTVGKGLILLTVKKRNHYEIRPIGNFVANNIYCAAKVDSMLWLGTERGIIKVNIPSLLSGNFNISLISRESGLISNQINHLLYVKPNVWAFSDRGFSLINKDQLTFANTKPRFYLKEISANRELLKTEDEFKLPYTKNNVQVDFGYISYNNQNIFTRYRLDSENPWSYTTNRNIQFNSLSPGIYNVQLQYSIDNINWMPAYQSPELRIDPPLWQTWYFQTIVAMLVLSIIVLYFVSQVRIFKRHQQKLIQSEIETIEHERSRIAKDLHDSVGTDFTAIKMIVSQTLKKYDDPKSAEIETQFQSTIHEIKSIIYGLSPPGLERYGLSSGLKNYIDKLNGTIPIKIEMNSFGPEIKDSKIGMTLFRIIQELISNSLKHSNAKTITLHINAFEDLLNIVYEDNGKGFTWDENHKGLGLYNIESRIQSMKGQLRFDSGDFGISYTIDIPIHKPNTV